MCWFRFKRADVAHPGVEDVRQLRGNDEDSDGNAVVAQRQCFMFTEYQLFAEMCNTRMGPSRLENAAQCITRSLSVRIRRRSMVVSLYAKINI